MQAALFLRSPGIYFVFTCSHKDVEAPIVIACGLLKFIHR